MKKLFMVIMLAVATIAVQAQTKKVSILGDSYSTFQGVNPEGYNPFYPNDRNDVTEVSQTWWVLRDNEHHYKVEGNIIYPNKQMLTWGPFYYHDKNRAF